ncbi:hypothetical protein XENOCAPTIV_029334, partial [Xenoophorus captivus]
EDGHKVIDIQTPTVSPSTQSVGSANSSGGATDLFSNSPSVPINNQPEFHWSQLVEKKPTGGSGWQPKTMCTNTNWTHATHPMAPAPMPIPQMVTELVLKFHLTDCV